ncbi:hypothetical protein WJX74_006308 [Apatococcus lobatus]|uniref:Enoyl reductase (ER) domain-containing protein n=1 Tax=Apatococcus lobatus TaxID=904363 RepID=A0AAW1R0K1_9CHLO
MKAVELRACGPPSVLQLRTDYPKPTAASNSALVRIHAAGINPVDLQTREGGVIKTLVANRKILGGDLAGVVESPSIAYPQFKAGDKVIALTNGFQFWTKVGCYAEYMAVPVSNLASMPSNLSFEDAAGVPLVALTAWQALDKAALKPGQRVLVQAGSGGVGSWVVQLAKQRGLHVTATCSTPNVSFVQGLGADVVIDYTKQSFVEVCRASPKFDGVVDPMGGQVETNGFKCLSSKGVFVGILNKRMSPTALPLRNLRSMIGLGPRYCLIVVQPNGKQLQAVSELIQIGKVKTLTDRVFPLAQAAEAHEYLDKRRGGRGKVVLQVT